MKGASLQRENWLRAARLALYEGGPDAVRVERLAAALGVTKGSFYWHFPDRAALLDALVKEWVEERDLALAELAALRDGGPIRGPAALRVLMAFVAPRVEASASGEVPSDSAMFAWAAVDPVVGRRVNAAEAGRIALLQEVVGDRELGEFVYLAYLGFLMRRRRVPASGAFFPTLASLAERIARHVKRITATSARRTQR